MRTTEDPREAPQTMRQQTNAAPGMTAQTTPTGPDALLTLVAPADQAALYAISGVMSPFLPLIDQSRERLQAQLGDGWYARVECGELAAARWLREQSGDADVWMAGMREGWGATALNRPRYAEVRALSPRHELRRAPHEQPYALRLARDGEAALDLRPGRQVARVDLLPPLAAALRPLWKGGLQLGSSLRRLAAAECALRGGQWLASAGMTGLSEPERAAQVASLWRESAPGSANAPRALEITESFKGEVMETPLLQAGWDALIASTAFDFAAVARFG